MCSFCSPLRTSRVLYKISNPQWHDRLFIGEVWSLGFTPAKAWREMVPPSSYLLSVSVQPSTEIRYISLFERRSCPGTSGLVPAYYDLSSVRSASISPLIVFLPLRKPNQGKFSFACLHHVYPVSLCPWPLPPWKQNPAAVLVIVHTIVSG